MLAAQSLYGLMYYSEIAPQVFVSCVNEQIDRTEPNSLLSISTAFSQIKHILFSEIMGSKTV